MPIIAPVVASAERLRRSAPFTSLVGLTGLIIAVGCSTEAPDWPSPTTTDTTDPTTTDTTDPTTTDTAPTTADTGSGGAGTGGENQGYSSGGMPVVPTVECAGDLPTADVAGTMHSIAVAGDKLWGELPHFWNTFGLGRLGLYLPKDSLAAEYAEQDKANFEGKPWSEMLKEQTLDAVANLGLKRVRAHGMFHDDIGMYSEDGSGNPVFNFERSDIIFDFLVENGISPIVELASMPKALAADASKTVFDWKMVVSPPKDYAKWQQLVQAFVQHSVDKYGEAVVSDWYFEVWNEPECCQGKFWGGRGTPASAQEYFQLYDAAAAGVRAVLPNGRMGGPVTSQPGELVPGTASQWTEGAGVLFLDHVTNNSQPLGFFAYHAWNFVSGSVDGYFQGLDLLDNYKKDDVNIYKDVPIAITEFGPTWEFGLVDEPAEMSQGAAFAAQTYSDVSRKCAQESRRFPITHAWWTLSDVFDEGFEDPGDYARDGDPFTSNMGLLSREGIKKPAYNTYKFLAQMGNKQMPLTVEGAAGVAGMAARDDSGGVQILIYNGQNPGLGPVDDTYYSVTDEHTVGVTLSGLNPEVAYNVSVSRVDDTEGNAYGAWEGMGRPTMAAMSAENWQELRDVMESVPESLGEALCGATFSQSFGLPSPGVLFIKLEPAVAEVQE